MNIILVCGGREHDALRPGCCIAFPGGKGTRMMVRLCEDSGVPVWDLRQEPRLP